MCRIIKQLLTFNMMDTRIYKTKNNIFALTPGPSRYNILRLINPCIHLIKNRQLYNIFQKIEVL